MTRTELLALASVACFSLACAEPPTGLPDGAVTRGLREAPAAPALRLAASSAAAEVLWSPFSFDVVGCEETVHVEGFSHTVRKDQFTGSGGYHGYVTVNAKGTGVGEAGGEYVWADKLTDYRIRTNGRSYGWKGTLHSRLIGKGGLPDLHFFGRLNYVMNANGLVTVDVEEALETCR